MVRKRLFLGIMAVVTATTMLLSGSFASATGTTATNPTTSSCTLCQQHPDMTKDKAIQLLAEKGVIFNESPSKHDTKVADKVMKDIMKEKDISNKLKEGKFKAINGTEAFFSFENIELGGYQYNKVVVISGLMKNTENKIVNYTAWVDVANNEAVKYFVGETYQNSPVTYASYEKAMQMSGSDFSTQGFTTNWGSFECSLAGWIMCSSYCGLWAVFNVVAGGVCETACTVAMAWACSVSYS